MSDFRQEFIEFAVARGVLCFGEFKTKAGRLSPYFFNAGLFNDGDSLRQLGQFYAKAILAADHRLRHAVRPGLQGHSPGVRRPRWRLPNLGEICRSASTARKPRITARGG